MVKEKDTFMTVAKGAIVLGIILMIATVVISINNDTLEEDMKTTFDAETIKILVFVFGTAGVLLFMMYLQNRNIERDEPEVESYTLSKELFEKLIEPKKENDEELEELKKNVRKEIEED